MPKDYELLTPAEIILSSNADELLTLKEIKKSKYLEKQLKQRSEVSYFDIVNLIIWLVIMLFWLVLPSFIFNKLSLRMMFSFDSSTIKFVDLLPNRYRENLIQEISDMRLEYYEAMSEGKAWEAKFVLFSYSIGLGWSGIIWIFDKFKDIIGIIPKAE